MFVPNSLQGDIRHDAADAANESSERTAHISHGRLVHFLDFSEIQKTRPFLRMSGPGAEASQGC